MDGTRYDRVCRVWSGFGGFCCFGVPDLWIFMKLMDLMLSLFVWSHCSHICLTSSKKWSTGFILRSVSSSAELDVGLEMVRKITDLLEFIQSSMVSMRKRDLAEPSYLKHLFRSWSTSFPSLHPAPLAATSSIIDYQQNAELQRDASVEYFPAFDSINIPILLIITPSPPHFSSPSHHSTFSDP